jgi:hypothetical protein
MITYVLDWITCTFHPKKDISQILPEHSSFVITDQVQARPRYDATYRLDCGGFFSSSRSDVQGCLLELSGQPLRALRNAGFNMESQAELAMKARNRSRLDFAVDIVAEGQECTPQRALDDFMSGGIKTKLRPNREITNLKENGGQSVYWGGESSDIQIRIYDKAAEMKMLWEAWTRVEMQVRGRTANAFCYDLASDGVEKAGCNWLWHKFKPLPNSWLAKCIKAHGKGITEVPRKATSFEAWIEDSIKPSFKKHMLIKQDRLLIEQLFKYLFD